MDEGYEIRLEKRRDALWAEIITDFCIVQELDDALDIIANCSYQGAKGIIMKEGQFTADFFDLKTRLAGEILQKFSNYRMKLLLVGNFEKFEGKSLRDFIRESNKGVLVHFSDSREEIF